MPSKWLQERPIFFETTPGIPPRFPLGVAARPNLEAARVYDAALLARYLRLEERAQREACL